MLSVICSTFSLWIQKKEKVKQPCPEWSEGFTFLPALQKLTITHEGSTKQLYHQECIAINTRGAAIYGSSRSYLRRMIMRVQYHEDPLLAHLAEHVPSRPVRRDADPFNAFLQSAPFQRRHRADQAFGLPLTENNAL